MRGSYLQSRHASRRSKHMHAAQARKVEVERQGSSADRRSPRFTVPNMQLCLRRALHPVHSSLSLLRSDMLFDKARLVILGQSAAIYQRATL